LEQPLTRSQLWSQLDQDWDLIVIGGGITGAGIFRRAVSGRLKTLLIEAADFSSGTSSKSSKLVHGGFRYLRNRQYDVTFESVRQREQLLKQAKNLVTPLGFVLPYDKSDGHKKAFQLGVIMYDLMAPKWSHKHLSLDQLRASMPLLRPKDMEGAYLYYDARLDDSRMVLRLIQESIPDGGTAVNYAKALKLLRQNNGQVCGIAVQDQSRQQIGTKKIFAKAVINATGPWTDELRNQLGKGERVRPLRGSHLIFSFEDLPLPHAVTLMHPKDGRAMFAIPWEGRTIFGTTDLDHLLPLEQEPYCTNQETEYMLEAVNAIFPDAHINESSIISSFAGLRPIVRGDASDPSAESRAHLVLEENGLITITGGKLTIFEIMAEDALKAALPLIGRQLAPIKAWFRQADFSSTNTHLSPESSHYLLGRYGNSVEQLLSQSNPADLARVDDLFCHWAELPYNARHGMVEHLDDLLLRRTRLGLLLEDGGSQHFEKIRALVQPELGWTDQTWQAELARYQQIYSQAYSPKAQIA